MPVATSTRAAAAGQPTVRPASPRIDLADRLLGWRDRLLSSARFQRLAARFPLTRSISRRRARALFDVVAGFTYSQILLACVQLRLFEWLLEAPRTADEIAQRSGLDAEATRRLLAAAVAIGLIEPRRHDRYGLGKLGAPMAHNAALTSMVEHHAALYADLADPVGLLRRRGTGSALGEVWGYARNGRPDDLSDAQVRDYSALMTASQPLVADQILDAYPLHAHRCLLDVGGGEGGFLMAVAARAPALQLMLFDLPAVAGRAQLRLEQAGLAARSRTVGGDFTRDALPLGADVISLVRVIHDHDDDRALRILEAVHAALPDGGTVVLAEPMAGTPGAEPMGDAYFGMYLLAMGSGRPRSAPVLRAMLERVGFTAVRLCPTTQPLQTRVMVAQVAK